MAKIKKDNKGLYTVVEGLCWRPEKPTRFQVGDDRSSRYLPKIQSLGIEKLPAGHHEEYWRLDER